MIEVTSGNEYKSELSSQSILYLLLHKKESTELVITHDGKPIGKL